MRTVRNHFAYESLSMAVVLKHLRTNLILYLVDYSYTSPGVAGAGCLLWGLGLGT